LYFGGSVSPPENPQQVTPEEKYYLLSPDVVDFARKIKTMYGSLSLVTYTASYNSADDPSDSTKESFSVALLGGDTAINLGLVHKQRKYAKSRRFDPRYQMRDILSGRCAWAHCTLRYSYGKYE
jgi:hypothetical protein